MIDECKKGTKKDCDLGLCSKMDPIECKMMNDTYIYMFLMKS